MKTEREIELEKQVATLRAALQGFIDAVEVGRGPWAVREARAAIADTNLGADWVPRAELEAVKQKLHDLQDASAELSYAVVIEKERHRAELQRAKRMGELALASAERAEAKLEERRHAELQRVAKAEKLAQAEVKRLEEIQAERARLFFEANAERAEVSLVLTGRIEAPQPGKLPTIARAVLDAHRVELRRVAEASWSAGHQSGCKCDHMVEPDGRGDCASERVRDLDAIVRQDCGTIWR